MQLPRKMSAQNVMASISRTLGNRHDGHTKHSNEVKLAGEESKDKLYEPKHRQKVVRVLTVVAYVVSVSLAAIILSLYYTFIWDPKDQNNDRPFTNRQNTWNVSAKVECLNLTMPNIELAKIDGSQITRGQLKSITNDTESLEKIPLRPQTNDEGSIEILPGPPENMEPVLKPSPSASPAIVQPEPAFIKKEEESKEKLTPNGDFGFI